MIALLISAIPAVAVGQTTLVGCSDCNHVASVYMGEGGFIATADGADMVDLGRLVRRRHPDR